jgi:uncharacterized protein YjbI with pentapeptide repeats
MSKAQRGLAYMDDRVRSGAQALCQYRREVPLVERADDLEEIKKAVDDAAAVSGGLWLSYLFVLFYIGVAAGAVTHKDLLLENPVKLPFLNTELPLLAFFALAPLLFVVTHAYTLAHFVMLGKKALRFHQQLYRERSGPSILAGEGGAQQHSLPKKTRDKLRRLLPSNIFVQILAGPPDMRGGPFGLILKAIAVTTLIIFPILLLLLLQAQFLPFHSLWISWLQRIALFLDLGLLWILRPPILSSPRKDGTVRKYVVRAYLVVAAVLSLAAVWLSILIATIPGEWQEKAPDWMNPRLPEFWAREYLSAVFLSKDKAAIKWLSVRDLLFTGEINLTTTRRRSSPFSNTLVLPGFSVYEALKIDDPKKIAWKEYLVDLRGRHLEQAMLFQADLTGADLRGARLQGAYLEFAQLRGASLEEAELQGADFEGAQLDGAVLKAARLQGANFMWAWLRGACLRAAQLQGAFFGAAQLQGVDLREASLQGASFRSAQLHGASLEVQRSKAPIFLAPIYGEQEGRT